KDVSELDRLPSRLTPDEFRAVRQLAEQRRITFRRIDHQRAHPRLNPKLLHQRRTRIAGHLTGPARTIPGYSTGLCREDHRRWARAIERARVDEAGVLQPRGDFFEREGVAF